MSSTGEAVTGSWVGGVIWVDGWLSTVRIKRLDRKKWSVMQCKWIGLQSPGKKYKFHINLHAQIVRGRMQICSAIDMAFSEIFCQHRHHHANGAQWLDEQGLSICSATWAFQLHVLHVNATLSCRPFCSMWTHPYYPLCMHRPSSLPHDTRPAHHHHFFFFFKRHNRRRHPPFWNPHDLLFSFPARPQQASSCCRPVDRHRRHLSSTQRTHINRTRTPG